VAGGSEDLAKAGTDCPTHLQGRLLPRRVACSLLSRLFRAELSAWPAGFPRLCFLRLDGGGVFCASTLRLNFAPQPRRRFFAPWMEIAAMSDILPMTRAGYNKIKAEINHKENEEMPIIAQRIADARAEGDLSENAEYHGARESQGMLQAKINVLKGKLANASIVDMTKVNKDEVGFSATILVRDLDFGDEEEFILVGGGEEDYDTGRILISSPLAQGFVGKKVGDKVAIEVPAGTNNFEILEIRYEEE
jgi:transcription elongation factor GreA